MRINWVNVASVFMVFPLAFVAGCAGDSAAGTDTTVSGDIALMAAGNSYCEANPATESGELCASLLMPADMVGSPEKVSFHFFSAFPPLGPPSVMGLELATAAELAPFVAGAEVPMVMENLPASGEGFLYAAVYMPGGGATKWVVVPGVDYTGVYSAVTPVTFSDGPINLTAPIELTIASE